MFELLNSLDERINNNRSYKVVGLRNMGVQEYRDAQQTELAYRQRWAPMMFPQLYTKIQMIYPSVEVHSFGVGISRTVAKNLFYSVNKYKILRENHQWFYRLGIFEIFDIGSKPRDLSILDVIIPNRGELHEQNRFIVKFAIQELGDDDYPISILGIRPDPFVNPDHRLRQLNQVCFVITTPQLKSLVYYNKDASRMEKQLKGLPSRHRPPPERETELEDARME